MPIFTRSPTSAKVVTLQAKLTMMSALANLLPLRSDDHLFGCLLSRDSLHRDSLTSNVELKFDQWMDIKVKLYLLHLLGQVH